MTENNELYDHLSAARVVYQDTFENELDIIRELKIYLIESEFSVLDNNQILYNFYQYINIPITIENITNVAISPNLQVSNLIQLIFNSNNFFTNLNNNDNYVNNNDNNVNNNDNNVNNNDNNVNNNDNNDNNNYNDDNNDNNNDNNINNDDIVLETENINNNIINVLNTIIVNLNNNDMVIQFVTPPLQNVIATVEDEDFDKLESQILTSDHDSNCSICMAQMIKDDKIILLNCSHNFHYDCITPYLKEYNYKCPICRAEVGKAKYNI
jgi:hypothetical protein